MKSVIMRLSRSSLAKSCAVTISVTSQRMVLSVGSS